MKKTILIVTGIVTTALYSLTAIASNTLQNYLDEIGKEEVVFVCSSEETESDICEVGNHTVDIQTETVDTMQQTEIVSPITLMVTNKSTSSKM